MNYPDPQFELALAVNSALEMCSRVVQKEQLCFRNVCACVCVCKKYDNRLDL